MGPLQFASMLEFNSILRIPGILEPMSSPEASEIKISSSLLLSTLTTITEQQIDEIKKGNLPPPPAWMGGEWDLRRTPEAILDILTEVYFINLGYLSQMIGSTENSHLLFGLKTSEELDGIKLEMKTLWEKETAQLIEEY